MGASIDCCVNKRDKDGQRPASKAVQEGEIDEQPAEEEHSSAVIVKASLCRLWTRLDDARQACTTEVLPSKYEDLGRLLGSYADLHPLTDEPKRISAQGAVCLARCRWRKSCYSGLFERADYCLLRLSSALPSKLKNPTCPFLPKAPGTLGKAVLVPFVALKVFRAGRGSGNLLFGGQKTGQTETNFFAHSLSSHLTERCSMVFWPVLSTFRQYSKYPAQTGLSDFATFAQDGTRSTNPQFPWALLLRPALSQQAVDDSQNMLQQFAAIPPGTNLYHIYACSSPQAAVQGPLQHIGDIITASSFIESALEAHLRFRHQLKEEDYVWRPEWESQLTDQHNNYGWDHFAKLPTSEEGSWQPCAVWQEEDLLGNDPDMLTSHFSRQTSLTSDASNLVRRLSQLGARKTQQSCCLGICRWLKK